MNYEQTYTPNVNIKAVPALCLGYVDDAGRAPNRSKTAKEAYEKEQAAGRIRLSDLPENVWVVVFFSFSKGSYTYPSGETVYFKDAWHVALARRSGNTVEVHDSEVHSGSRGPYPALTAVEAWFRVYAAKFVGWSTDCDGRQYVKEVNKAMDYDAVVAMYRGELHREPESPEVVKSYVGMKPNEALDRVRNSQEWKKQHSTLIDLYPQALKTIGGLQDQVSELTKQLENKDSGAARPADVDVTINGEKYVKESA